MNKEIKTVLDLLGPHKGEFYLMNKDVIRHRTALDLSGCPACPLVYACHLKGQLDVSNTSRGLFSRTIGISLDAVGDIMSAADNAAWQEKTVRDALLETLV